MRTSWIIPLACLAMVFTLTACSGSKPAETVTPKPSPTVSPSVTPEVNGGHQADSNGSTTNPETDGMGDSTQPSDGVGNVNDNNGNTNDGLLGNASDALKDVANGTRQAVRDMLR